MYRFNCAEDITNELIFQDSKSLTPDISPLRAQTLNNSTEDIFPRKKIFVFQGKLSLTPNVSPFEAKTPTDDNENEYNVDREVPKNVCFGGFHPVEIGDVLKERYEVIGEIASGGFSVVWQCRDLLCDDQVAIKIVESNYTKFAHHEITCLEAVIDSDLFVKLLSYFVVTGINGTHTCMVFEMLNGNLLDLIVKSDSKGIPLPNVKTVAKQLLQGLDYLHNECNIIHGDIKMENILSSNEDDLKVKIADFGHARCVDSHSEATIGTLEYHSPEMILQSGYGPSTDIWSLACVIFELATGDYLFCPRNTGDGCTLNEKHLALMIQLLGKVPKRICSRGLDSFSSDRMLKIVNQLKPCSLYRRLTEKYNWDTNLAIKFSDFLLPMLDYDPDLRSTANECLSHEWFES